MEDDVLSLKKSLIIDKLLQHIEKYFFHYINSDPEDEQEKKIVLLLRDYKERSTSGLPEARNVIKAHIKNLLLTGFTIYHEGQDLSLTDKCLFEEVKLSEENKLADCILPFDEPEKLTGREKFEIILYLNREIGRNGRDSAFKNLLDRHRSYEKTRKTEYYESLVYEYDNEDIDRIYSIEAKELDFADKLEIIAQRIYEELFGLKHIDILAYSDINEVGFSNDGRYIYCWCSRKIRLGFMALDEGDARVVQDRAISFGRYSPQLDVSHPEILCHRGDGARITVTQKPYFSSRNLCIRIFNQSSSGFLDLITIEKLRALIIALVKTGESICLQGSLGSGKTTTMNIMYELLDDCLHIGTVEDYFEQHIMDKYPGKRIVEGQSINGKELSDVVKTMLRMSVDVANIGEVRDGNALFSFIQLVQSVSVAAWFTTHITNPETTVPRLKNMLTGTGRYFSEQSAVMDIIHYINMIFQHEIINGQIMITRIVEIIPLVAAFSELDYRNEPDIEKLRRLYYLQQIQGNPNNMFTLNTIMEMKGGNMKFVNYPSVRMIEKSKKSNSTWKYVNRLLKMIEEDTGVDIPEYARERNQ